jgi:hypothetical protein
MCSKGSRLTADDKKIIKVFIFPVHRVPWAVRLIIFSIEGLTPEALMRL